MFVNEKILIKKCYVETLLDMLGLILICEIVSLEMKVFDCTILHTHLLSNLAQNGHKKTKRLGQENKKNGLASLAHT